MHLLGRRAPDDDRGSGVVRVVDRLQVGDVVEHERALEVDGSLECDLRDLAARRAEPALAHQNATVSPGSGREDLDAGRGELAERVRRSRQQSGSVP